MDRFATRRSFALDTDIILKDLLQGIQTESVSGAVLFLAPDLDCKTITAKLDDLFPYVGCTTHSAYSHTYNQKQQNQTATILLFMCDGLHQRAGLIQTFSPGEALFSFSVNDSHITQYTKMYRMIGGVAAENFTSNQTAVWVNHQFIQSGTVALTIPTHPASIQVARGWAAVDDHKYKVTSASSNYIVELDNRPIREIYSQYIDIDQLLPSYPLMVVSTGQTVAPLQYCLQDGIECLLVSKDIAPGEYVQICFSNRTDILHETHAAAMRSYIGNEQHPREFSLCISGTSRAWLLSDMEYFEFDYLQKFSGGREVDNILVYLNGEFEPTVSGTNHHNHSAVIAAFYASDCDLISEI